MKNYNTVNTKLLSLGCRVSNAFEQANTRGHPLWVIWENRHSSWCATSAMLWVVKPVRVYKKVYTGGYHGGGRRLTAVLATCILLPGELVRMPINGSWKCRASTVYVKSLAGWNRSTRKFNTRVDKAHSRHSDNYIYREGMIAVPSNGFHNGPEECQGGIHFFFGRNQAEHY